MNDALRVNEDGAISACLLPFFFFSNKETLKGFGRCFCCCGLVFGGILWGFFCWFIVVFVLGFYLFCVAVCVCLFNLTALFCFSLWFNF